MAFSFLSTRAVGGARVEISIVQSVSEVIMVHLLDRTFGADALDRAAVAAQRGETMVHVGNMVDLRIGRREMMCINVPPDIPPLTDRA
jgi:hypothetical protein